MFSSLKSILLLIIILVIAVIFSAMYVSALRHRSTKEHELSPLSGSLTAEMLWMTIPALITVVVMLYAFYYSIKQEQHAINLQPSNPPTTSLSTK